MPNMPIENIEIHAATLARLDKIRGKNESYNEVIWNMAGVILSLPDRDLLDDHDVLIDRDTRVIESLKRAKIEHDVFFKNIENRSKSNKNGERFSDEHLNRICGDVMKMADEIKVLKKENAELSLKFEFRKK